MAISGKYMDNLCVRLSGLGIEMEYGPDILQYICNESEGAVYGARNVKAAITTHLESKISQAIISGNISSGDKVRLSMVNDMPVIDVKKAVTIK